MIATLLLAIGVPLVPKEQLAIRGEAGDRYVYEFKRSAREIGGSGRFDVAMRYTERVVHFTKGRVEWSQTFDQVSSSGTGPFKSLTGSYERLVEPAMSLVTNERNESLLSGRRGPSPVTTVTELLNYPAQPVGPGDTWVRVSPTTGNVGKIRFTLVRFEPGVGTRLARILAHRPATPTDPKPKPYAYVIDVADGRPVSVEGSDIIVMQGRKVRTTFSLRRIPSP